MEFSMNMFMGCMLIIGLLMTIFAFKIGNDVTTCSVKAQNALRGLLVMGVGLMSISSTSLLCGCTANMAHPSTGTFFIGLMAAIGIITMTLTSIIHSECIPARADTPIILTLSVLATVLSVGYLGYKVYNYVEHGKSGHKSNSIEMATLAKFNFSSKHSNPSPPYRGG
jgi:hypothetical protein